MSSDAGTVLVVEDDDDVRIIVSEILTLGGFQVVEAPNAHDALNIVKSDQPIDLLFTDIIMPGGMNGFALAHEARQIRPELRIAYTSGYFKGAGPVEQAAKQYGPLIGKPYSPEKLCGTLKRLMAAVEHPA